MAKTKIEWATDTWNPITGCTPISEGCANCYAKRIASRLRGKAGYPENDPFKVTLHPDRLDEPLRWRKPRNIFVCSMGDLFHEDVPEKWVSDIYVRIMESERLRLGHIFIILTKRPKRMAELIQPKEPLTNLWLGVTAENQKRADERIPILLQIPAAVRFVSVEPMLGPVDLSILIYESVTCIDALKGKHGFPSPHEDCAKLDWVICGGESGPGARPMHPDWVRSLRDQCQIVGIPFFFKQWGEWAHPEAFDTDTAYRDSAGKFKMHAFDTDNVVSLIGKKRAGRLLDGQVWDELPGD